EKTFDFKLQEVGADKSSIAVSASEIGNFESVAQLDTLETQKNRQEMLTPEIDVMTTQQVVSDVLRPAGMTTGDVSTFMNWFANPSAGMVEYNHTIGQSDGTLTDKGLRFKTAYEQGLFSEEGRVVSPQELGKRAMLLGMDGSSVGALVNYNPEAGQPSEAYSRSMLDMLQRMAIQDPGTFGRKRSDMLSNPMAVFEADMVLSANSKMNEDQRSGVLAELTRPENGFVFQNSDVLTNAGRIYVAYQNADDDDRNAFNVMAKKVGIESSDIGDMARQFGKEKITFDDARAIGAAVEAVGRDNIGSLDAKEIASAVATRGHDSFAVARVFTGAMTNEDLKTKWIDHITKQKTLEDEVRDTEFVIARELRKGDSKVKSAVSFDSAGNMEYKSGVGVPEIVNKAREAQVNLREQSVTMGGLKDLAGSQDLGTAVIALQPVVMPMKNATKTVSLKAETETFKAVVTDYKSIMGDAIETMPVTRLMQPKPFNKDELSKAGVDDNKIKAFENIQKLKEDKKKSFQLSSIDGVAKEYKLPRREVMVLAFGGGFDAEAEKNIQKIEALSNTEMNKRDLNSEKGDGVLLDLRHTNTGHLRKGQLIYKKDYVLDLDQMTPEMLVKDVFEDTELYARVRRVQTADATVSSRGSIGGQAGKKKTPQLPLKSFVSTSKEGQETWRALGSKFTVDQKGQGASLLDDQDFKTDFQRATDKFSRQITSAETAYKDWVVLGLDSGKYAHNAGERVKLEIDALEKNLVKAVGNDNEARTTIIREMNQLRARLDTTTGTLKQKGSQILRNVVFAPYSKMHDGRKYATARAQKNADGTLTMLMRHDAGLDANYYNIFNVTHETYHKYLDALAGAALPGIDTATKNIEQVIQKNNPSLVSDFSQKIGDARAKISSMKMGSRGQGEIAATDIPLQYVFKDIERGLATEQDAVELLDAINLPQLPMEKRLGRFGAFEYVVKAQTPTETGKTGARKVNLSDDYLWGVHPKVEIARGLAQKTGKKFTKKDAMRIVNAGLTDGVAKYNAPTDVYADFSREGRDVVKTKNGDKYISTMAAVPEFRSRLVGKVMQYNNNGGHVLSIGMGTGTLEAHLLGQRVDVVGLEIDPGLVKAAKDKGVPAVRADGNDLPFADKTFDTIVISESLEHLDINRALSEANRVLTKEGRIVIASNIDDDERKEVQTQHSRDTLRESLLRHGFDQIGMTTEKGRNETLGEMSITFVEAKKNGPSPTIFSASSKDIRPSSPIDRAPAFKLARSSTDSLISSPVVQESGINSASLFAGDLPLQHILTMAAPPPPRDKKSAGTPPPEKKPHRNVRDFSKKRTVKDGGSAVTSGNNDKSSFKRVFRPSTVSSPATSLVFPTTIAHINLADISNNDQPEQNTFASSP
ncbi:MAG: class I SAM-dependent methyltransferase, partial [Candidatus Omnitrophica bacterium]|nr:class I SAM-dependent methyltransferase [Candidatus Omnitrophota bacterium]